MRLKFVLAWLPAALVLNAGVTWQETVRSESFDSSVFVKSRVPGIDPPLFDIPLEWYAPPLHGRPAAENRIYIDGDRLARVGKEDTTIFDLKARTITVVRPRQRSYSRETMAEGLERLRGILQGWHHPGLVGKYTTAVQKTGRTKQASNQTAEEYRIIAITPIGRRVFASSIYWMTPNAPTDELTAFRKKWSAECELPFPGTPPVDDNTAFAAMARIASKLPGFPIGYVVVTRPLPGAERTVAHESAAGSGPESGGLGELTAAGILLKLYVTETAYSDFTEGSVDPTVFNVPAGYKQRKPSGYTF